VIATAACSSVDTLDGNDENPGTRLVSSIVACKTESDCEAGETCGQGFCQMKRCSKQYTSRPPIGQFGYAFTDRALVVAAGSAALDVYSPHAKGDPRVRAEGAPLDLAGGNLTGSRPEGLAYVRSGASDVFVFADGKTTRIPLGFQGTRVATGDVDGDGLDEIVVAGSGQYAVCRATNATCARGSLPGIMDDVAIGDLDGNGAGEILFIANHTLTVVDTSQNTVTTQPIRPDIKNIAAGDLDGDGKAELIGTSPGGPVSSDELHVFRVGGAVVDEAQVTMDFISTGSLDVVFAKRDDKPFVAVLSSASRLRTFTYANRTLQEGASETLRNGGGGARLAAADVTGRSARVRLKGEPTVTSGPVVPIAVLTAPPYSTARSAGPSSITFGDSKDTGDTTSAGESKTTTVSLMVGGGVALNFGVGGAPPTTTMGPNGAPVQTSPGSAGGAIGGGVSYFFTKTWSATASRQTSVAKMQSVGGTYSLTAEPLTDGYQSGAVVLAGGCFHKYVYTVEDPAKVLADGVQEIASFVPVGGESKLWSTARYNALADAVGDGSLPKIAIATKLGNVASYPAKPTTLDGRPIPAADLVFKDPPVTRTSDVGSVGFNLSTNESTTNTDAASFSYGTSHTVSLSAHGSFKIVQVSGQLQGTVDTTSSLDNSYSVTVGTSASFSGNVAPVRDDPATPANEATLYGYSFRPYVYRHRFTDKGGREGAFYAITYTAGE